MPPEATPDRKSVRPLARAPGRGVLAAGMPLLSSTQRQERCNPSHHEPACHADRQGFGWVSGWRRLHQPRRLAAHLQRELAVLFLARGRQARRVRGAVLPLCQRGLQPPRHGVQHGTVPRPYPAVAIAVERSATSLPCDNRRHLSWPSIGAL